MKTRTFFLVAVGFASLAFGCAGSPASPFNNLQGAPVTIYRLQNYSTSTTTPTAGTNPLGGLLSSIGITVPTEYQQQVSGAQSMICALSSLIPGCDQSTTPIVGQTAQFEGYTIIGQAAVSDSSLRDDLIDIFGYEKSFQAGRSACFYPEFGFAFGSGATYNTLVSYSCNAVQGKNFSWPHPETGMTDKTVKALNKVIQRAFGG